MNDVLVVTEAAVRGLSISRLRLLIFLLQGHVVSKPGNLKYSDRAVRILAAGKQPFYAAQWEAVQALAQNAKFDLQLFGSLKEAADHAISTGPSPRRAHFVPTPPPAASDTGPVDSDDDWQSVEGPSADPQGRAAPEFKGLELAENPFGRLAILEAGMEDEATSPIDHSRSKLEGDLLQVATADPGPCAGPAKRAKRSHGAASLPVAGASQALSLGAMDPAHPVPPPFSRGRWTRPAPKHAQRHSAPRHDPPSYAAAVQGTAPGTPLAPLQLFLRRLSTFLQRITDAPTSLGLGASKPDDLLRELALDAPHLLAEAQAIGVGLSTAGALLRHSAPPTTASPSFPPHMTSPMSDQPAPTQTPPSPPPPARPPASRPAQAPWTGARTLLLRPLDAAIRRRPIGAKRLAAMANMALQHRAPPGRGRSSTHVARAKRTARGDLLVEIAVGAWRQAKGIPHLDLEGLGRWEVAIWDAKASRARTSLVVKGVPISWSMADFTAEFLACNGDRYPGVEARRLSEALGTPHRLKRRSPAGWTDSSAVRLDLPPDLAKAILAVGFAVVALESQPIRPFQALPTVCARCQRPGHKAAFCRNAPRCRHCLESTGDHDTRECPRATRTEGGTNPQQGVRRPTGPNGPSNTNQRNVGAQGAHPHHD